MLAPFLSGAILGSAFAALRIDVQLVPDTWTDISCDVVESEGVRAVRGMRGNGPLDMVASTGVMTFALRNDSGNSGSTQGWYSPNHANVRSGWAFGIPVRLVAVYGSTDYPLWTGKIRQILPLPGQYRSKRVMVTAHDLIADLADARVRELPVQTGGYTEVELLRTITGLSVPEATEFYDTGIDVYPFAFDDAEEGESALGLISSVIHSSRGKYFVNAYGYLRYRNRHHLATQASSFTLSDCHLHDRDDTLVVPSDFSGVYNRVTATLYPRTVGNNVVTVLYELASVMELPTLTPVVIWGTYVNEANPAEKIGGADFQPLVAGTDYTASTDAAGTNPISPASSAVSITAETFGSSVKFTVVNIYGSPVYLQTLQQRGRAIYNHAPLVVQSYEAQDYGDRSLSLEMRYQDDINIAQGLADYVRHGHQDMDQQVQSVLIAPQGKASDLLLTCLQREIGDVVTVTETMTGIASVPVMVQGIEWAATEWPALECRWIVAPHRTTQAWILADNVAGVLGTTTILGYA